MSSYHFMYCAFENLDFFPIDSTYKVTAAFKLYENPKTFAMPTTTDRTPEYKLFGTAYFHLGGKEYSLEVYQNQQLKVYF